MIPSTLHRHATKLSFKRKEAVVLEAVLRASINDCISKHGSARVLADAIGVSQQYLCDVKFGRRNISDSVLEKLIKAGS